MVPQLCAEKTGCGDEVGTDGWDTRRQAHSHATQSLKFREPLAEINKNSDVL